VIAPRSKEVDDRASREASGTHEEADRRDRGGAETVGALSDAGGIAMIVRPAMATCVRVIQLGFGVDAIDRTERQANETGTEDPDSYDALRG
jgi:hypothetical protein